MCYKKLLSLILYCCLNKAIYTDLLALVIYFMNFMNFDFKLFSSSMQENMHTKVDCCFKLFTFMLYLLLSFLSSFFKVDLHSTNVSCLTDAIHSQMVFFNLHLRSAKCCLPNKFVLITSHKQPLKCVQQNSYLDLWSNTLYIWQGVHLIVKLQARGTNK